MGGDQLFDPGCLIGHRKIEIGHRPSALAAHADDLEGAIVIACKSAEVKTQSKHATLAFVLGDNLISAEQIAQVVFDHSGHR